MAWAGGLFEGEGTFTDTRCPAARIVTTDKEVRDRFAEIIGVGSCHDAGRLYAGERKLRFTWNCYGFEKVQAVMAMLWPYLCERRRQQAQAVLY